MCKSTSSSRKVHVLKATWNHGANEYYSSISDTWVYKREQDRSFSPVTDRNTCFRERAKYNNEPYSGDILQKELDLWLIFGTYL